MGQTLSCRVPGIEQDLYAAVQSGELKVVESILQLHPGILRRRTLHSDLSVLHIAAANGHLEVLSMLLDLGAHPNALSRQKRTPLMLAAMRGKLACIEKLLRAEATILLFDSVHRRTCLHYAAYYGHSDCLQAILQTAHSSQISDSWGFSRFVNVRDAKGETPLHLAAKQNRLDCVRTLLEKGALVSASSGYSGFLGSTPLHLAAREGSLECVRELLAWGADRLQMDSAGRTAYVVASRRHPLCAALLNPSSAEPLVWPSPLKFLSELNPDVKLLLEKALVAANRKREKKIMKGTVFSLPSPARSESVDDDKLECNSMELCCICFEQACTIEVQDCGHQMCAHCTVSLCCHSKPKTDSQCHPAPACPFCRSDIARLVVANSKTKEEIEKLGEGNHKA
ncbi:E3 ubiquitin-protein ligase XB3-like [Phalaenopsis equestris]|uniref:E3 ubiquitin-protein ligase XB3-like n=1 Tax=Phalaenopsis equestris TaxID=78828 RepID=UPI0009E31684|nr:E3 ubiquitin-protein ligase XB3-like [Phalaenopsis equestris]